MENTLKDIAGTTTDRESINGIRREAAALLRIVLAEVPKAQRAKAAADTMAFLHGRTDGGIYASLSGISGRSREEMERKLGERIMERRNPNWKKERK